MKRELIEPHKGDNRFMRRKAAGQFAESDDVADAPPSRRDAGAVAGGGGL